MAVWVAPRVCVWAPAARPFDWRVHAVSGGRYAEVRGNIWHRRVARPNAHMLPARHERRATHAQHVRWPWPGASHACMHAHMCIRHARRATQAQHVRWPWPGASHACTYVHYGSVRRRRHSRAARLLLKMYRVDGHGQLSRAALPGGLSWVCRDRGPVVLAVEDDQQASAIDGA
jgi:hypothetical protein